MKRTFEYFPNWKLLSLLLVLMVSCNYYKPVQKSAATGSEKVAILETNRDRVFILHVGSSTFLLSKTGLDASGQVLSGIALPVPVENSTYISSRKGSYAYKPSKSDVTQELHLYANAALAPVLNQNVSLRMDDVQKIEVIEHDRSRSTNNTVLAVVAGTAGGLAAAVAIAAAMKSSCPFVSVYNQGEYQLQGETFGGALLPSLARNDFLPLPDAPPGEVLKISISNELQEEQFTDMADLLLLPYAPGEKVLSTIDGNFYRYRQEESAITAHLQSGTDMLLQLAQKDNKTCSFNDTSNPSGANSLYLKFAASNANQPAQLLLSLRNAYWIEYVYGKFTSHFGESYSSWRQQQHSKPAEEILQWQKNQLMPMSISVQTANGWQFVQSIPTIGPLMNRDVLISLPAGASVNGFINISLTTGFMFWEVDKAAITYGQLVPANEVLTVHPVKAADDAGKNVLPVLLKADGVYMEQLQWGDRAFIEYQIPAAPQGLHYAVVMHSKGYYEPVRKYSGKADLKFLKGFRKEGAFPAYSLQQFQTIQKESLAQTLTK